MEKLVMGEENFNEGGAGISSIIWKKKEKINMKSFFYWKWGAALKLKTNKNGHKVGNWIPVNNNFINLNKI